MKTVNENFRMIDEITGGLLKFISSPKGYLKLKSAGYMDLTIERLGANEVSLTHYYLQNGDLVPDPDMQIEIDFEKHSVGAVTFQNSLIFQTVHLSGGEINLKLQKDLNLFLHDWLKNLKAQGFYQNPKITSD